MGKHQFNLEDKSYHSYLHILRNAFRGSSAIDLPKQSKIEIKRVFFEESFELVENLLQPITTQIWVVTHQQRGISALVPQMSF